MKVYKQIPEDAEYREMYDSYRRTVDNLNSTDFLYDSMLSNGQVFFKDDEVYGFVNGQPALRNRNLIIPKTYIDDFTITNFILYTRMTNELITLNINCNLADYRDNKMHYLYVVLDHNGTYEVHDDMFQSDENKIIFARFLIGTDGNSKQFYMMLPFAGSADYIKGNQFYQVTDGLRVNVVNNVTKQITVSKAKIRFSAINFDDKASPDCITIDHNGESVPIHYVYWDSEDNIPRVNWDSSSYELDFDTIMNYETGRTSRVAEGNFSVQKFYYDVYNRCIVALYGNASFETREDAIYAIDSVMQYPLPDGIEYLIPIACIVMQNTTDPIDETNFRIVNLDYNEQEVLDSDTFTRQQAAEAVEKARQALANTETLSGLLANHTGNVNNPHKVRLDQLLRSDGEPGGIDDSFAEDGLTVTSLIARATSAAGDVYYSKRGGTIEGSTTITQTLTVNGQTSIGGDLSITGNTSHTGHIYFSSDNSKNIGTSNVRPANIYSRNLNVSGSTSLGSTTTGNLNPDTTGRSLGGTTRWGSLYVGLINSNNGITTNSINSTSYSGSSMTLSSSATITKVYTDLITNNYGYIKIGGYALYLGTRPSSTATTVAYAISE